MIMPNFLVIGAAKAGTTSLHQYLNQHPQIFMSPSKEPKFFAFEGEAINFQGPGDEKEAEHIVTTIDAYSHLFRNVSNELAIGESSTVYLYSPKAPERIKHYIPEAKLIAILRDPVDRAYSNFLHLAGSGREPLADFALAIEAEAERIRNNWWVFWHYKQRGFYYEQVKRYFDYFEPEQIKLYLYEDFISNPAKLVADVFTFLDVDNTFMPDLAEKARVSRSTVKNKTLNNLLTRPNPIKSLLKPLLPSGVRRQVSDNLKAQNKLKSKPSPQIRQQLIAEYEDDILKLQNLIQRDLSNWLKVC